MTVRSKEDEAKIVAAAEASVKYILVECPDWKIIPLENLIAKVYGKTALLALTSNLYETKVALETLELGVDGIVVESSDINEILEIYETVKETRTRLGEVEVSEKINLMTAKVVELKPLNAGARVCIDTCDLMKEGEGLLVGCQSNGLFLVEAEVHET
ncbi:MAG: 3-dehydroquinate synthase II, partial [Candidatus Bathyarchaeia archaeon]